MIDLTKVELINYVIHESYSSLIFKIKVRKRSSKTRKKYYYKKRED
jgi:hypothetical protein